MVEKRRLVPYSEKMIYPNQGLDNIPFKGLSEKEAAERLKEEGYNELPTDRSRSFLRLFVEVLKEPMFLLLIAAGLVYLFLGDRIEAITLLVSIVGIVGITLYQEQKVERVLGALRDLTSPRAMVIREGNPLRIAGREVVRGDLLVVIEGDRVPADAKLLSTGTVMMVDESLLTGESSPVPKNVQSPHLYSGSMVVQGRGFAEVTAIGSATELGQIGKMLKPGNPDKSLLQRETGRLVKVIAMLGFIACGVVVLFYGLIRGGWLEGILAGLTLAMAILPEEFPVVLTVFLALGAWRISQKQVLTRRSSAVEALGSAMVLCVDKTGTLTQNRMEVKELFLGEKKYRINHNDDSMPEEFHPLLEFSILASDIDPFDPMEKAFQELGKIYLEHTEHLHEDWTLVREYPLEPALMAMSHVWKGVDREEFVVATKGAPEAIADLCHLPEERMSELERHTAEMASEGLRVLGVAKAEFRGEPWPRLQHDFEFEFLGLIGLADPLRPTVRSAIQECYSAGIRVVMMTGDYAVTARAIASQAGLTPIDEILTGHDLGVMDDSEFSERIKKTNIFARLFPEQKLRLVRAFKAHRQVVAMTGDGVNDAPALKGADIGIAMGKRGTDVAREASALVLLDDDFSSIVHAIREGRRIFDNLQRAMSYLVAVHIPIAGLSLIPLILGWPLIFTPIHIVFMEFIIDPACSIVFEAEKEDADIMKRPPRSPDEPLFRKRTLLILILQGTIVLFVVLGLYGATLYLGWDEQHARAMAFTSLIVSNLAQIITHRSMTGSLKESFKKPNPPLWGVLSATVLLLTLVLFVPSLAHLFRFSALGPAELLVALLAGIGSVVWFEIYKVVDLKFKPR